MRRLPRHLLTLCSAVSLVAAPNGCCGLGAGPSEGRVRKWVGSVPVGSPGEDMYALLEAKGFATRHEAGRITTDERITDTCLGFGNWIKVSVQLDEFGRVASSQVSTGVLP